MNYLYCRFKELLACLLWGVLALDSCSYGQSTCQWAGRCKNDGFGGFSSQYRGFESSRADRMARITGKYLDADRKGIREVRYQKTPKSSHIIDAKSAFSSIHLRTYARLCFPHGIPCTTINSDSLRLTISHLLLGLRCSGKSRKSCSRFVSQLKVSRNVLCLLFHTTDESEINKSSLS